MRFVEEKPHCIIDYLLAFFLIFIPYFIFLESHPMDSWVSIIIGLLLFGYSGLTKYYGALFPKLSYRIHLILDLSLALALIAVSRSAFYPIALLEFSAGVIIFLTVLLSKR